KEQIAELAERRTLDQNALDRDARLAGVAEAPGYAAFSSPDQIGVAMNNDACVSAELKHNLLLSRAAFDIPTDWRAAGETDQLDAVVGNQYPCVFVGKRKHIERSVWKASLLDSLGEEKCSERRLWRRLQNNRAAAGDGWRHLVSNQIQREIEWCDSGDWAD